MAAVLTTKERELKALPGLLGTRKASNTSRHSITPEETRPL